MNKKYILNQLESVLDSTDGDLSPKNRKKLEDLKKKVENGITVKEFLVHLIDIAKLLSGIDDFFTNI